MPKKYDYKHNEPVLTKIRGIVYPSMGAAARAHGLSKRAIAHAMDNGTLDNVGTGKSKRRAFTYEGTTYSSQADCARAYGVLPSTFNDRLLAGRDPVTGQPLLMPTNPRAGVSAQTTYKGVSA